MPSLLLIAAATLLSEDLTTVGVGLAVRDGAATLWPSLAACVVGIYAGDVGLWALGRYGGRRVLTWRVAGKLPHATLERLGAWVDRHPGAAIVGSRFLPGTAAAVHRCRHLGRQPGEFSPGCCSPSPSGPRCCSSRPWRWARWWRARSRRGWERRGPRVVVAAGVAVLVLRAALSLAQAGTRARLSARLARARRWEFWPSWLLNAPVALWVALLAVRHRGLLVFTAANPAIEDGGVVGESKSAILARLPAEWVIPWAVVAPGAVEARLDSARATMAARGWRYPIVVKPDAGERGSGVRWVGDDRRLAELPGARAAPGRPSGAARRAVRGRRLLRPASGRARGRIFSITDKRFPVLTGDGRSTLAAGPRASPLSPPGRRVPCPSCRVRDRVLAAGEPFRLARAGNHAQGTEFRDGRALWTPALERRIDEISRHFDGFYFGRFDVRYRDRAAFMAGEDLAIVELNGVTSEATHIYDPGSSIFAAWRTLMEQWSIAFAIGAANRRRGCRSLDHAPPGAALCGAMSARRCPIRWPTDTDGRGPASETAPEKRADHAADDGEGHDRHARATGRCESGRGWDTRSPTSTRRPHLPRARPAAPSTAVRAARPAESAPPRASPGWSRRTPPCGRTSSCAAAIPWIR